MIVEYKYTIELKKDNHRLDVIQRIPSTFRKGQWITIGVLEYSMNYTELETFRASNTVREMFGHPRLRRSKDEPYY